MKTKLSTLVTTWEHANFLTNAEITNLYQRVAEALTTLKIMGIDHRTRRGIFEIESGIHTVLTNRKLPTDRPTFADEDELKRELDELTAAAKYQRDVGIDPQPMIDRLERSAEALRELAPDNLFANFVAERAECLKTYAMDLESQSSPRIGQI